MQRLQIKQQPANAQPQDPNANNTGEGSINTTLTFDDPAISTNDNRQDPTVTVTDHKWLFIN